MADNLIQKKGESTWYVKLAIPAAVQHKFGNKAFIQSLKTGLRKEAMDRRLPILATWKAQIRAAKEGVPLPEGWQDEVISTSVELKRIFDNQKLGLVGMPTLPLPPVDPTVEARMKNNPRFVAAFEAYVKEHLKDGMAGKVRLLDDMSEKLQSTIPKVLARRHSLPAEKEAEVNAVLSDPDSHKAKTPFHSTRLQTYRAFRESRGGAAKHIDQQVGKMERLGVYLAKQGLKLDFDAIDAWLKSLDRAPKTLGQYLMAGTAFWKWAMKYDARWRENFKGQANPFENHDLPQGGGKPAQQTNREAYTTAELAKLHEGAIKAQNNPLADLILLGSYTGARIEELCQLKREHVIDQDGIQSFNIAASKTKAGIRIVPVHPALTTVVSRLMQDSTDDYLIPVSTKNQYGKRSHAISKAFGRLRTSLGFGPQYVFHSIRNTVVTYLARADVSGPLIAEIVGHETGTVTFDVYARGASAAQKLDAISRLPTL
ncbi:hypothetical protein PS627_01207 [Pseudomonas fluorescens]|uniref:tyrosine-type recombinase/integrase n=1 Tax=Pseudomonas fluorescens TaxID=294 RepID=UPI00130E3285|nr:tyrosine-type recombinase/integrase [Pseudomonas fluorescens]CAG8865303.1 hypothetical protein PS627_01207 [Pseudomonas fluorescens]